MSHPPPSPASPTARTDVSESRQISQQLLQHQSQQSQSTPTRRSRNQRDQTTPTPQNSAGVSGIGLAGTSSPLNFPSSSSPIAGRSGRNANGNPLFAAPSTGGSRSSGAGGRSGRVRDLMAVESSSGRGSRRGAEREGSEPLFFPNSSSSPATGRIANNLSSPSTIRGGVPRSQAQQSSQPQSQSQNQPRGRRLPAPRGDIHSSAPVTSPSHPRNGSFPMPLGFRKQRQIEAGGGGDGGGGRDVDMSDGDRLGSQSSEPLNFPASESSAVESVLAGRGRGGPSGGRGAGGGGGDGGSSDTEDGSGRRGGGGGGAGGDGDDEADFSEDENGQRTVIWGTLISLQRSINHFRSFLLHFTPRHRASLPSPPFPPSPYPHSANPDSVEASTTYPYQNFLRMMRETGETNLNLSLLDLFSFGKKGKELYEMVGTWPQEMVPVLDQVVKDVLIEQAESDNLPISEIEDLESQIFKVRPVGGEAGEATKPRAGLGLGLGAGFSGRGGGREAGGRAVGAGVGRDGEAEVGRAVRMRDLNPGDIDKLVTIKGLVIRSTPIIPDMKTGFFRCISCSHTTVVEIDRGRIAEPDRCPRDVCNLIGGMQLVHNRCEFSDRQVVRLQETPDAVPDGQTPHTVSLCLYDELVDVPKPGDRITVTGIFRSVPVRLNPRQRTIKTLFKTYIDVVHIRRAGRATRLGFDASTRDAGRLGMGIGVGPGGGNDVEEGEDEERVLEGFSEDEEDDDAMMDDDDGNRRRRKHPSNARAVLEAKVVELSQRPNAYDLLARSIAPSIWEMDDVKKGILLQLFGGTNKTIGRGGGAGGPRYRGDINVLLVGDPGTSKSQMLTYVHKIAPRGVYTSGKGSSAVGLTAYVTRDPDSKQLVLESGALVLSDGGVCCIDEFDKMSDATRSVLHEVMEQQTVSIAKAGIITTLNARTSILAAANPVGSKYNPDWPITKNIDLPPTLVSRFDLLYLVLDRIDEESDRKLARWLCGMYLEDRMERGGTGSGGAPLPGSDDTEVVPMDLLTQYLTYARHKIHPVLTESASKALVENYVEMRKLGEDARTRERRVTATTRQLESMIRLSEAHARMRLSSEVTGVDVHEAYRLIRAALKESATDPNTGLLDMDLLNTGQGTRDRKMRGDLKEAILGVLSGATGGEGESAGQGEGSSSSAGKAMRWNDVLRKLEEQSDIRVEPSEFTEVVRALETEGLARVSGGGGNRMIRKLGA